MPSDRQYQIGEPKWKNPVLDTLPTYRSWNAMRHRCTKICNPSYARYGGRGISVCERWEDFDAFVEDMGIRPVGTTIERLHSDGNYEPGNCCWATPKQQAHNRRNNHCITYAGRTMPITAWAEELNIPAVTLYSYTRRRSGEQAIARYLARMEF